MKEKKAKNKNWKLIDIVLYTALTLALIAFAGALLTGLVLETKPAYPAANQAVGPISTPLPDKAPVICIYAYPALNQAVGPVLSLSNGWIVGFPRSNQAAGPLPPALASNQAAGPIGK